MVVNCAGRTRSIIGAQAIINAGVPNKVVALENGTMAWLMAGYTLDTGKSQQPPLPKGAALEEAKAAAARLRSASAFARSMRPRWQKFRRRSPATRSLYVLDVRSPEEYEAGHLPGARWAPGGQLVQAFDEWVATFNARIVLVDGPDAVRATLTASWLIQMNVGEVLRPAGRGRPPPRRKGADKAAAGNRAARRSGHRAGSGQGSDRCRQA